MHDEPRNRRHRPGGADRAPRRPAGRPGRAERAGRRRPDRRSSRRRPPSRRSHRPPPRPWAAEPRRPSHARPTSDRYTPAPEPRADWARSWDQVPPVTPERWYEPAPTPAATTPATVGPRREGRAAAGRSSRRTLLSAVLASGGTVLALGAAGALDRPAAAPPRRAQAHQRRRRPAGRHRRIVGDDRGRGQGQPGRRADPRHRRRPTPATSGSSPPTGVGSGVIFDSNGWILTNHHVVEGGEKFDVELKDGRVLPGTVYGIDTLTDLAIVKVDATGLPTAAIGESDALKVGQLVIAIGSPLGHLLELGHQRDRVGQGPLDHDRQQRAR